MFEWTAVRSGDYYLFEDLDEKVELDLIHERPSAGIEDALSDKKLGDKLTIEQVCSPLIFFSLSILNILYVLMPPMSFEMEWKSVFGPLSFVAVRILYTVAAFLSPILHHRNGLFLCKSISSNNSFISTDGHYRPYFI